MDPQPNHTDAADLVLQPRLEISLLTVDLAGHGAANPIAIAARRVLEFLGILPVVQISVRSVCPCGLPGLLLANSELTLGCSLVVALPARPRPHAIPVFSRN